MLIDSKNCINRVEKMLNGLGLMPLRLNDRRLKVTIEPRSGGRYVVYFTGHSGYVLIEAVVFKGASGEAGDLNIFYEALLAYNASFYPFSWALTQSHNNERILILNHSLYCSNFDARELKRVIETLNDSFTIYIPRIRQLAESFKLKFTGSGDFDLAALLKGIFGM